MTAIDPRIVRVSVEVNGRLRVYQDLDLRITGTKYANANQNECEVKIANAAKDVRDYLLTETSPFNANRTPKIIRVYAGRQSYGDSLIYEGDITRAGVSQPPDIVLSLKSMTKDSAKGDVIARQEAATTPLSTIAQSVAADLGLTLDFQAKEKAIANYGFTGGALKQVDKLGSTGAVNAYVDDGVLVVKDFNIPLTGVIRVLNVDNGMVGQPEFTEQGCKVKFLIDNQTKLGGGLRIQSVLNPAVSGLYTIYKLGFEICNRDVPFYWVAEATRG